MIRVLHVVTQMNRNGLENRIMDIYRNIDKDKIQFDFLVHRGDKGHFDDEIMEMGGRIYHIDKVKISNLWKYCRTLTSFFNEHKEYKIVHSHVNTLSTLVLGSAKNADIPIRIAHSRTWGMEKNIRSGYKLLLKLFINLPTTHKFACSRQAGIWLFGKKGIEPPKNYFKVIRNSFDINRFLYNPTVRKKIRNNLKIKNEDVVFINVGRLVPQKNQRFLVKVFSEIKKNMPNSKLLIVGEGEMKEKLVDLCEKEHVAKEVIFLGSKENVGDYLSCSDCFIFPSKFEGFGTVAVEAQCNGLPIFASDSIPPETKVSDLIEFLPLKESPSYWAEKIVNNIKDRKKVDRASYLNVVKKEGFDIKDTYKFFENFYQQVTKEAGYEEK